MPNFMPFQDLVPLLEGFFEFGGTPGARESAFLRGVRASEVPLVQGVTKVERLVCFDIGKARQGDTVRKAVQLLMSPKKLEMSLLSG